jgi:hypothetical protein
MKKLLLKLAAFLALGASAFALLFAVVVLMNRQALDSCRLGPDVESVILGESHTAWAIDDAAVPGVRNISLNAEGYKYTYLKLQYLLRTEPQLRRVYLAFSYNNLSDYFDAYATGPIFRFFAERYIGVLSPRDYFELVRKSPRTAPDLFMRVVRGGLSNGVRQRCVLYGTFSSEPMTETFRPESMEARIIEQYYSGSVLRGQSVHNRDYLERIIQLARAHNLELVALNTPLHPEYEKRIPGRFREWHDGILLQYGIPSYDFAGHGLGDAGFLPDGDHTNYAGAMVATRLFAEYHRTHPLPFAATAP